MTEKETEDVKFVESESSKETKLDDIQPEEQKEVEVPHVKHKSRQVLRKFKCLFVMLKKLK